MKRFLAALLLTLWAVPALGQLGPGGGSIGPSGGGGGGGGVGSIAIGTTAITGGTTGRVLFDNGGFVGEFALGTGVQTALGVNIGSAGAFVTFNGALGTPSSGTLTNATGLPISGLVNVAANTMLGNWTGSTAAVLANTMPSCSDTTGNHLNYVNGTGVTCGTSRTAVSSFTGSSTRDLTTATGSQAITGLGFRPSSCILSGSTGGTLGVYTTLLGMFDSAGHVRSLAYAGSSTITQFTTLVLVAADATNANNQVASISSVDADGFTLSWVKSSSPTGTFTFAYTCYG